MYEMSSSSNPAGLSNPIKKYSLSYPLCALLAAVAALLLTASFYNLSFSSRFFYPYSVSHIDPFADPPDSTPNPHSPSPPPAQAPAPDPNQGVLDKISVPETKSCDYSEGKWVPTKVDPLYNATTCETIKPGQNCVVHGRPDSDYLYWRWKPHECDLPRFDPEKFLKLMENKHIAFVGDSLARNHLESLLCMMATVSKPNQTYTEGEDSKFRKWHFPSHNINVSIYWSPLLVKGKEATLKQKFNVLHLDKVDERWMGDSKSFDMLVISAGQWFFHPAIFRYGEKVIGCHVLKNCTEVGFSDAYAKALRTSFQTIVQRKGSNGEPMDVLLVTFPPAHFEGDWDKLGSCSRTQPYKPGEKLLEGVNADMRRVGVEKVKEGQVMAEKFGGKVRFEALDVTKLALLRPDGHPGPYMYAFPFKDGVKERVHNDCVHWCLPGPIDTWNDILLQMIINKITRGQIN